VKVKKNGYEVAGMMQETEGTINLKISRLQQQMKLLQQRYILSNPYPQYQAALVSAQMQAQDQLRRLILTREALINHVAEYAPEKIFNGDENGQKSFRPIG
jgi:chaperonin cofactor prefoldin